MKNTVSLFSLIALAAAGTAIAAEPNFGYQYIDAEYRSNKFEGEDGNGHRLEGSFRVGSNYFITIGLTDDTIDVSESETMQNIIVFGDELRVTSDLEFGRKDLALGFGGAWPLSDSVDFTAQLQYLDSELEFDFSGRYRYDDGAGFVESGSVCDLDASLCFSDSVDDSGFALKLGLRGALTERLEMYGDAAYYNLDLIDDAKDEGLDLGKTALELGARFAATDRFAITLGYLKQGDLKSAQLGARFSL